MQNAAYAESVKSRASFTAEIVCLLRGASGLDPYATAFLSPPMRVGMRAWSAARRWGLPDPTLGVGPSVLARHRYIDGAMLAAIDGGARQVVLLGAGYDARPWRFGDALARCTVFEVDHPATAARRRQRAARLPDTGARQVVVDFAAEDFTVRLADAGFDPEVPAFFAWEGVSMYLPRESVVGTLKRIARSAAPGSTVALDLLHIDRDRRHPVERLAITALRALGEPVVFGIPVEHAAALLEEAGLAPTEVRQPDALCANGHPGMYVALARVPA